MLLQPNGIDVWYVDESSDPKFVAVSAFSIPLLRDVLHHERIIPSLTEPFGSQMARVAMFKYSGNVGRKLL